MANTWNDLIFDALLELGVYYPGESLRAEDQQICARKLRRIIDVWTARRVFAYDVSFQLYTLTPNHAPHLIGPGLTSPDFATPNNAPRPQRIESASLVLNTQTPAIDSPQLNIRDDAWWAAERVKGLTSNVPTDLYYSAQFPDGELNFWPVPNFAYQVRLELWTILGQLPTNLASTFAAPPAYESTLLYSLAIDAATAYGRPVTPELTAKYHVANKALQSDNDKSPRTQSADWGNNGVRGGRRGDWNYFSGGPA
jgi:hypothetical protein